MPSTQENYILQQRRAPILQLATHQPGFSTSTVPIPLFDRANTTTSNVQTLSNSNQDDGRLDEILVEDDVNREASVETGWDAYAVVIGAWFALFVPTGLLNTIGTYQAFLGTHQLRDYSDQQIGWIFSVYAFLLVFGGSQVGKKCTFYHVSRVPTIDDDHMQAYGSEAIPCF